MPNNYNLLDTLIVAKKIVAQLTQARTVNDLKKIELLTHELHGDMSRLVIDALSKEITITYVRNT